MSAHQAMYPIRTMARVLKVSASGYYAWRSRPASARATADADLTRHIRTIHAGSHGTYGAPRVHAELKADGLSVGRKRIARLMRAAGIAGVSRRRSAPITTRQATDHHPASDLVRRNFMDRDHAKACRPRKCPPKGKSHLDAKNRLINTDTLGPASVLLGAGLRVTRESECWRARNRRRVVRA